MITISPLLYEALDAKMSVQSTRAISLPNEFKKSFPHVHEIIIVTFMGESIALSSECKAIPIRALHDYLLQIEDID